MMGSEKRNAESTSWAQTGLPHGWQSDIARRLVFEVTSLSDRAH